MKKRKIFKKLDFFFKIVIFFSFLFSPLIINAGPKSTPSPRSFNEIFTDLTDKFVEWVGYLFALAIGVAVVLIASSSGDPIRLNTAKRAIMYAVIGLIIVEAGKYLVYHPGQISGKSDFSSGVDFVTKEIGKIAAIIGLIVLGYGIFEFATSVGDTRKIESAKMMLTIGLISIIFGSAAATGNLKLITSLNVKSAIGNIFNILGIISTFIGLSLILFGIFKFAVSGGEPKAIIEAREYLLWGVIAIILGLFLTKGVSNLTTYFGIKY